MCQGIHGLNDKAQQMDETRKRAVVGWRRQGVPYLTTNSNYSFQPPWLLSCCTLLWDSQWTGGENGKYRIVLFWQGWILRSLLWLKTFQGRSVLRNGISQILPFSHFWEPMTVWRESTKQGMTIEQGTGLTEKWDFQFIFMF